MNKFNLKNFLITITAIALIVGGYLLFSAIYTWHEEKEIRADALQLARTKKRSFKLLNKYGKAPKIIC